MAQQDVELNITCNSHEQVPLLTKELTDLNDSLRQASRLEQEQRLKIADLEQQLTQQDAELNITRSSHEQVPTSLIVSLRLIWLVVRSCDIFA